MAAMFLWVSMSEAQVCQGLYFLRVLGDTEHGCVIVPWAPLGRAMYFLVVDFHYLAQVTSNLKCWVQSWSHQFEGSESSEEPQR